MNEIFENSKGSNLTVSKSNDTKSQGSLSTAYNRRDNCSALESLTTEEFLSLVGSRVRQNRLDIGMSRKLLAKTSGVSERYLAQLESGQGNISIGLLRKVAQAVSVTMEQLMAEEEVIGAEGTEVQ